MSSFTSVEDAVAAVCSWFSVDGREPLDHPARLECAALLVRGGRFSLCRRLLDEDALLSADEDAATRLDVARLHAFATLLDVDLPSSERTEQALAILRTRGELRSDYAPGGRTIQHLRIQVQAGAVLLARWSLLGRAADLFGALQVYRQGLLCWPETDPAPHLTLVLREKAAYVLDILSNLAGGVADQRLPQGNADELRREVVRHGARLVGAAFADPEERVLTWFAVGECQLGLGHVGPSEAALTEAVRAADAVSGRWFLAGKLRDLLQLTRMKGHYGPETRALLERVFGYSGTALDGLARGRLGLALSGGGLRASFFHLGVLARLAETDQLREVEVISCVSGGAIVGTYYYLWLKCLLEALPDEQIRREHYVRLVELAIHHFQEAVDKDLRMVFLLEATGRLGRVAAGRFRVGDHLADLYERHLYARVAAAWAEHAHEFGAAATLPPTPRLLAELRIVPTPRFELREDNPNRRARVPMLLVGATTLNTGHAWEFTSSYMGEPPTRIRASVDGTPRLRRFYHRDAAETGPPVRIAEAVAASSAFPSVFPAVRIGARYPGMDVALVDGGVIDNLGVSGLLENQCARLLLSDANAPLALREQSRHGVVSDALRVLTILQQRIRAQQYEQLGTLERAGLHEVKAIQLSSERQVDPRDWAGCLEPYRKANGPWQAGVDRGRETTPDGLRAPVVQRLTELRTDLDVHAPVERHGLMLVGYLRAGTGVPEAAWPFLSMAPFVQAGQVERVRLRRVSDHLERGARRFFRWLERPPALLRAGGGLDVTDGVWGLLAGTVGAAMARLLGWTRARLLRDGAVP